MYPAIEPAPELSSFIHCRNCPVFAAAARTFFDRPAPEGYLHRLVPLAGTAQLSKMRRDERR